MYFTSRSSIPDLSMSVFSKEMRTYPDISVTRFDTKSRVTESLLSSYLHRLNLFRRKNFRLKTAFSFPIQKHSVTEESSSYLTQIRDTVDQSCKFSYLTKYRNICSNVIFASNWTMPRYILVKNVKDKRSR